MNRDVTSRALAARLETQPAMRRLSQQMETGMALEAKLSAFSPNQEHSIR
jgi:hypothetical protein